MEKQCDRLKGGDGKGFNIKISHYYSCIIKENLELSSPHHILAQAYIQDDFNKLSTLISRICAD